MSQVLEGNYYQATPHGYVNRGKQVIKFASKVNHLPIHSRCHQLLRSESHPLIIQKHERLQEVHCFFKSHENKKTESRFKLSLEKMRRSGQNEAEGLNNISSKIQYANNQTPRYKQEPACNDNTQNPESVDKNLILPQINQVGQQKNIFIKNGKQNISELKNPLKQTISLMSLEKQQSEKSNKMFKINTPKTALHKNVKERNQTIRTESEDGEITEHAVYQIPAMKHMDHDKSQQKILDELSKLLRKVGKMQQKIQISKQSLEKAKINEQMLWTEKELIKVKEQNSRLKNGTKKCQHECSYSHIGNSGNLHLFIMFLFGLIFAKAVFC